MFRSEVEGPISDAVLDQTALAERRRSLSQFKVSTPLIRPIWPRLHIVCGGRRLLSSADTDILEISWFKLVTVGDRSFPVAGPRVCNNLPETVRSASTRPSFKRQLKTDLFFTSLTYSFLTQALP